MAREFGETLVARIASPAQPIRDAARTMKEIDAGFLPVGENDRLVGIVTDRDIIVRALAESKGPDTPVRDVMTQEVLYCFEDDDFGVVSSRMGELKVRRLPVLNASKRLIGIDQPKSNWALADSHPYPPETAKIRSIFNPS